jgi:hypothetical protein
MKQDLPYWFPLKCRNGTNYWRFVLDEDLEIFYVDPLELYQETRKFLGVY